MRLTILILLAALAISCSQHKSVTSSSETRHRYTTVYQGNKIIRYDCQPRSGSDNVPSDHLTTSLPKAGVTIERKGIEALPTGKFRKRWKSSQIAGDAFAYASADSHAAGAGESQDTTAISSRGGANIGIGILLIIVALPVFLYGLVFFAWGLFLIGILVMLLGIGALIFGIILIVNA